MIIEKENPEENSKNPIDEYDDLILELRKNREEMGEMLDSAVAFRRRVDDILPSSTDFKKRWVLDEKMKLIVSIFGVELDIRKQKETSLKTEIELRRKISGEDKPDEANFRDIAALSKAIERIEGTKRPKYDEEIPMDH